MDAMQLNTKIVIELFETFLSESFLSKYGNEEMVIECLDLRDEDPFDSEWVEADKLVSGSISKNANEQSIEKLRDEYRNKFFSKVIHDTGSADLAAYVSEDIELILGAAECSISSEFIIKLLKSYEKGVVPNNHTLRSF